MKNKRRGTKSDWLLFATFAVAAPRFVGVFATARGVDLVAELGWVFLGPEILSGVAMALLEGVAIAYIGKRWRRMERNIYWKLLGVFLGVLLLSLPLVVMLDLFYAMKGAQMGKMAADVILIGWTFMVALTNPLIAVALGLVDSDSDDETPAISERLRAWDLLMQHGGMTPLELSEMLGGGCTPDVAEDYIEAWVEMTERPKRKNGR